VRIRVHPNGGIWHLENGNENVMPDKWQIKEVKYTEIWQITRRFSDLVSQASS